MASPFSALKLAQLKHLAFKCGIPTTGTKSVLSSLLQHEINSTKFAKSARILSIDMGIRNLAYCVLDVPAKSNLKSSDTDLLPTILSWHRLAVSKPPLPAAVNIDGKKGSSPAPIKEAFDPATLSRTAYTLLRSRLLPHNPTHILIERQRFRSMGSKHILEWTIRVNMFESIIYAVLSTLKEEGVWSGEVVSVAPGRVGGFWVGDESGGQASGERVTKAGEKKTKDRKSKSAKTQNKGAKMDLVRQWLESREVVQLGDIEVVKMAQAYNEKWDRTPGGRKRAQKLILEGEEKMGKLDDLADCLLQGMAWVHWEENKRIALRKGVQALLEP